VKNAFREFIQEGWIIAVLGGMLMTLRLFIVKEKAPILEQLKKIFVASCSCAVAFFLLDATEISEFYKAIIYGVIGVTSPEIIQGIVKLAKSFSKDPEHFVHMDHEKIDHSDDESKKSP
jgi:hypothetical protein